MATIEANVQKYWDVICRCIQEPTVISHLAPILSTGESQHIRRSFMTNHQQQGVQELMSIIVNSRALGKWRTFVHAIRKADYPYLADLLENKHTGRQGDYEQKMIQIFSPQLEKGIRVNDIIADLYAQGIITTVDRQEIEAMYTNRGNTYATIVLLDRMQGHCSPKKWYQTFLRILRKRGYKELAADMEPDMLTSSSSLTSAQYVSASDTEELYDHDEGGACGSLNEHVVTDKQASRQHTRGNLDAPHSMEYPTSSSQRVPALKTLYQRSNSNSSAAPNKRPSSAATGRTASRQNPAERQSEQEQKPEFKGVTKFYLRDKGIYAEVMRSEDGTTHVDVRIWLKGKPTVHGVALSKAEWRTFVDAVKHIDRALDNKADYEHRLGEVVCSLLHVGQKSEVRLQKVSRNLSGSGKGGVRLSEMAYATLKQLIAAIGKALA